jgi:hypothetical protein|tara:strand:- start:2770 stop:2979 length:210 start_codon:yes stop_codon:yes gene_type:complete
MTAEEKAEPFCEEYTNTVLVDNTRGSILVNIKAEYFHVVYKELQKLGFKLVFKTSLKTLDSITCTFIKG